VYKAEIQLNKKMDMTLVYFFNDCTLWAKEDAILPVTNCTLLFVYGEKYSAMQAKKEAADFFIGVSQVHIK